MAKVRHHLVTVRKPLNLTKVGVAKHKVGGATVRPTNCIGNYARDRWFVDNGVTRLTSIRVSKARIHNGPLKQAPETSSRLAKSID